MALGYPGPAEYPGIHFDMYTAPAFLATILAVVNLVLLVTVFQEHRINDTGNLQINTTDDDAEQSSGQNFQIVYIFLSYIVNAVVVVIVAVSNVDLLYCRGVRFYYLNLFHYILAIYFQLCLLITLL